MEEISQRLFEEKKLIEKWKNNWKWNPTRRQPDPGTSKSYAQTEEDHARLRAALSKRISGATGPRFQFQKYGEINIISIATECCSLVAGRCLHFTTRKTKPGRTLGELRNTSRHIWYFKHRASKTFHFSHACLTGPFYIAKRLIRDMRFEKSGTEIDSEEKFFVMVRQLRRSRCIHSTIYISIYRSLNLSQEKKIFSYWYFLLIHNWNPKLLHLSGFWSHILYKYTHCQKKDLLNQSNIFSFDNQLCKEIFSSFE